MLIATPAIDTGSSGGKTVATARMAICMLINRSVAAATTRPRASIRSATAVVAESVSPMQLIKASWRIDVAR